MDEICIGIMQFGATNNKKENQAKIEKMFLKNYAKANLVVLPEYSMADITGMKPKEVYEISEPINGPWVKMLSKLAVKKSVYIVGTLFERTKTPPKVYNTAVVIDKNGKVISTYRKIHLFDAYKYRESDYMLSGDSPMKVIKVCGVKVAVAICFDIRFPELFRYYALNGAEIIIVPSAWYRGPAKEEVIRFLAQARAHENTVYLIVSIQYGDNFTGRSMIVDPTGIVIFDAGIGEKYAEIDIDIGRIKEVRKSLPVLNLRKPEIYPIH